MPPKRPKLSAVAQDKSDGEDGAEIDDAALMEELPAGMSPEERKKQLRLMRNRLSAQLHRQRQRAHADTLEAQVTELSVLVEVLRRRLAAEAAINRALTVALQANRGSGGGAPAPALPPVLPVSAWGTPHAVGVVAPGAASTSALPPSAVAPVPPPEPLYTVRGAGDLDALLRSHGPVKPGTLGYTGGLETTADSLREAAAARVGEAWPLPPLVTVVATHSGLPLAPGPSPALPRLAVAPYSGASALVTAPGTGLTPPGALPPSGLGVITGDGRPSSVAGAPSQAYMAALAPYLQALHAQEPGIAGNAGDVLAAGTGAFGAGGGGRRRTGGAAAAAAAAAPVATPVPPPAVILPVSTAVVASSANSSGARRSLGHSAPAAAPAAGRGSSSSGAAASHRHRVGGRLPGRGTFVPGAMDDEEEEDDEGAVEEADGEDGSGAEGEGGMAAANATGGKVKPDLAAVQLAGTKRPRPWETTDAAAAALDPTAPAPTGGSAGDAAAADPAKKKPLTTVAAASLLESLRGVAGAAGAAVRGRSGDGLEAELAAAGAVEGAPTAFAPIAPALLPILSHIPSLQSSATGTTAVEDEEDEEEAGAVGAPAPLPVLPGAEAGTGTAIATSRSLPPLSAPVPVPPMHRSLSDVLVYPGATGAAGTELATPLATSMPAGVPPSPLGVGAVLSPPVPAPVPAPAPAPASSSLVRYNAANTFLGLPSLGRVGSYGTDASSASLAQALMSSGSSSSSSIGESTLSFSSGPIGSVSVDPVYNLNSLAAAAIGPTPLYRQPAMPSASLSALLSTGASGGVGGSSTAANSSSGLLSPGALPPSGALLQMAAGSRLPSGTGGFQTTVDGLSASRAAAFEPSSLLRISNSVGGVDVYQVGLDRHGHVAFLSMLAAAGGNAGGNAGGSGAGTVTSASSGMQGTTGSALPAATLASAPGAAPGGSAGSYIATGLTPAQFNATFPAAQLGGIPSRPVSPGPHVPATILSEGPASAAPASAGVDISQLMSAAARGQGGSALLPVAAAPLAAPPHIPPMRSQSTIFDPSAAFGLR